MFAIGSTTDIAFNKLGLYEGNLRKYLRVIFFAPNVMNPYHNFRHMGHVFWLCYEACIFYREFLTPRQIRNLLVAALFHDYGHSGQQGNDDLNIERAVRGFREHIAPEDEPFREAIEALIRTTEFPHKPDMVNETLLWQIIRDADMAQTFHPVWIQQVLFGLAAEWRTTAIAILKMQENFLRNLRFHTQWAQQVFTQEVIERKIIECQELLMVSEEKD